MRSRIPGIRYHGLLHRGIKFDQVDIRLGKKVMTLDTQIPWKVPHEDHGQIWRVPGSSDHMFQVNSTVSFAIKK